MADIVERLRTPSDSEETMKRWDYIRAIIEGGDKGSWPRDIFESILSNIDEEREEAADEIAALRDRCEKLVKALGFYADEKNWSDGGFSDEDGPNVLTLVMCSTDNDRGEIARAALSAYRKASDDLKEAEGLRDRCEKLEKAASAVIAQWDTPNWKLTEPTAKLIEEMRSLIQKQKEG